jgi:hypothetical protein
MSTSPPASPRATLIQSIVDMPSAGFVRERFFDCIPVLFGNDRNSFLEWKTRLATLIEVDPACVIVVGSAALGVSLNPKKGFSVFGPGSDVDVGIVSQHHFSVSWRFLRSQGIRRTRLDVRTRLAWDEHVSRYIYWGTIATDRLLGVLPFGKGWLRALSEMSRTMPTQGRDINLRIYADHEALRAYLIMSVERAKTELITGGQDDAALS